MNTLLAEAKQTHMLDFLDGTHLALHSVMDKPLDSSKNDNDSRGANTSLHNETVCTET